MAKSSADSSIEERVGAARELFSRYKAALMEDPGVRSMIRELEEKIEASRRVMHELGVDALCRQCDEKEGGSCCGRGIESRYRPGLLLLNLAMGASLPGEHLREDSCFFLGEGGCVLSARHVLCVNYLCKKIEEELTLDELIRLQRTTGEEMEATFVLHEAAKRLIRSVK